VLTNSAGLAGFELVTAESARLPRRADTERLAPQFHFAVDRHVSSHCPLKKYVKVAFSGHFFVAHSAQNQMRYTEAVLVCLHASCPKLNSKVYIELYV
jgi:hypothetical protein